jgi:hypothetical protein
VFVGNCGLPVLVYDFTGDGLAGLVIGNAQSYRLKWLEQKKDGAGRGGTVSPAKPLP